MARIRAARSRNYGADRLFSTTHTMPAARLRQCPRRTTICVAIVAVTVVVAFLAVGATAAVAAFPSSPLLDDFTTDATTDATPNPAWITPALGEPAMHLDTGTRDFTGASGDWAGALWSSPFAGPVEAWATMSRAGTGDAALYANVTGGTSGAVHPSSGYFVDFGGPTSGGSPHQVSIWRIDGVNDVTRLTFTVAPYGTLQRGDEIGMSMNNGVIIAWYRPVGGAWTAVVSTVEGRYTNGRIALEAIPGGDFGFAQFGGGTPAAPVTSRLSKTTIAASVPHVDAGRQVTYTATVTPAPGLPGGSVAFLDNGVVVPACAAVAINAAGRAVCPVTYTGPGNHLVDALYTGTPDGTLAGSTNGPAVGVTVLQPTTTTLLVPRSKAAVASTIEYTATVVPAPDGGTVAFTDRGKRIAGCGSRHVRGGVATCSFAYRNSGRHTIRAAYSGDPSFDASASATRVVRAVAVLSGHPRLQVVRRALSLTIGCAPRTRGCRVGSTLAIAMRGTRTTITLKRATARVAAGHARRLVVTLTGSARRKLHSYLVGRRSPRLTVTVHLSARDAGGTSGSYTFTYTITGAGNLAPLR